MRKLSERRLLTHSQIYVFIASKDKSKKVCLKKQKYRLLKGRHPVLGGGGTNQRGGRSEKIKVDFRGEAGPGAGNVSPAGLYVGGSFPMALSASLLVTSFSRRSWV